MKNKNEQMIHNRNFIDACNNAINGIIYATTTQDNIKKQLLMAVAIVIISLFMNLSRAEFLVFLFSIVLIILMEMVNTAIETVVDLYVDCYHPKAKIAKDLGAGAVVIAALNAVIVSYFLFFDTIGETGKTVLENIISSPVHIAFVALVLTIIAVIALKATGTKDKYKYINRNFTPSGHTAIAFAALTAIWLNTNNIVIFTFSLILSIMVAENRIECKGKKMSEILFGACMGVIIVLLVYSLSKCYGMI